MDNRVQTSTPGRDSKGRDRPGTKGFAAVDMPEAADATRRSRRISFTDTTWPFRVTSPHL